MSIPTNLYEGMYFREGTSDQYVINEVMVNNEYGITEGIAGKTVLDIGGHIGSFSVLCAKLGARSIMCFEPQLINLPLLKQNTEKYPNITVVTAAVGRSDHHAASLASIEVIPGNNPGGNRVVVGVGRITVPVVKFDDIIDALGTVDLLKIDCEGSEFPILYTTRKLDKIGAIVGEFHSYEGLAERQCPNVPDGRISQDYTIESLSKYLHGKGMRTSFTCTHPVQGLFMAWRP